MTLSPAKPNRIWAIIENEPGGGVYRSDDAGATWTLLNQSRDLRQRAWYFSRALRRSERHEHRLQPERRHVRVARRRQDVRRDDARAAAATITTSGSRRTIRKRIAIAYDQGAAITTDGGTNMDRARDADGTVLSCASDEQGAVSTSAARSRTRARCADRCAGRRLRRTRRRRWWARRRTGGADVAVLGVLRRGGRRVGLHGVRSDRPERHVRRQLQRRASTCRTARRASAVVSIRGR